jgi:ribosomal protein S10
MDDIINNLERLAEDIRADLKDREQGKGQWVRATIALCQHLAQARDHFKDHIAFGKWFELCGFGLNKDERAVAIAMGRDLERAREVLEATKRTSLQLIFNKEFRVLSAQTTPETKPEPMAKKNGERRPYKKRTQSPELTRALFVYDRRKEAGEPITGMAIALEADASKTTALTAIKIRQLDGPVVVDTTALTTTAQTKIEVAMRAYQKKLDAQFEMKVMEEARRRNDELSIPHYLKQIEQLNSVLNSPMGRDKIMTKGEYTTILKCLHPDSLNTRTVEQLQEAFTIFNSYRARLADDEPERKTASRLPQTREELLARKKR